MPNIKNESGFPASFLTAICPCHCTLDWCIMHHDYGDAPDTENCYQKNSNGFRLCACAGVVFLAVSVDMPFGAVTTSCLVAVALLSIIDTMTSPFATA